MLYEPGRGGRAALDRAAALVEREAATLSVVAIAPQAPAGRPSGCCGADARAYNQAVAQATAEELREARARLGPAAHGATFKGLIEGSDPPLTGWIAVHNVELVLLPARRRAFGRAAHPDAARLQALITAEVRVIDPKAKPTVNAHKPGPESLQQASVEGSVIR